MVDVGSRLHRLSAAQRPSAAATTHSISLREIEPAQGLRRLTLNNCFSDFAG